jgi:hypothetical protein
MKRNRRDRIPPPTDAKYRVGEVIEFTPEDDKLNAGKPIPPVELTPVGPAPLVIEFAPEDETVRPISLKPDHPLNAWFQHLLATDRAAHPNEFVVFDLVVFHGRTLPEAAAQIGIPVTSALDAYHLALTKLRRAMRADPIYQLLKDALKPERTSQM